MSLTLPTNFALDVQGRDTNLVPLVVIGKYNAVGDASDLGDRWKDWLQNALRISTNSFVIDVDEQFYTHTLPILLNIPSLKESIDIEKRNYKISNVTLDISNIPYEGIRFSDRISDSLINTECRIYWISPSVKNPMAFDSGDWAEYAEDSFFQVYYGTIRKYTHDDEKVRLVAEDRSQATLHRDLPLPENYLGTGADVPDKYKNKPIPMVFGHVEKSPCVFKVETLPDIPESSALKSIIVDSKPITQFMDARTPPSLGELEIWGALFIGDSSLGYVPCARTFEYNLTTEILDFDLPLVDITNQNYSYDANNATITLEDDSDNDIKRGVFRGIVTRSPINVVINSTAATGEPHSEGSSEGFIAIKVHNTTQYTGGSTLADNQSSENWLEDEITTNTNESIMRIINDDIDQGCHLRGSILGTSPINGSYGNEYMAAKIELVPSVCGFDADSYFIGAFFHHKKYNTSDGLSGQLENIAVRAWFNDYVMDGHSGNIFNGGATWFDNTPLHPSHYGGYSEPSPFTMKVYGFQNAPSSIVDFNIGAPKYTFGSVGDAQVHIDLWTANIFHVAYVDKLVDRDFYVDVMGRPGIASPVAFWAEDIISIILRDELGVENISVTDLDVSLYHSAYWGYGFTINEKINSKKLIEGLASASPYIPRFDNMGNFKFNQIKRTYMWSDPAELIKAEDVISSSFSRTPIEDVYTKVILRYKWDYAMKKFNKDYTSSSLPAGYSLDYYGLTEDESILDIDDDRGKYIRSINTASAFTEWMVLFHCNQHLKIKVRMPLKYMNLEIGDIVRFDKVIDVKPYGISYHKDATVPDPAGNGDLYGDLVNGQQVFPDFMVISTNKTLEYCEIECMQMHNLTTQISEPAAIYGCTNPAAWNYNEDAEVDDGSCLLWAQVPANGGYGYESNAAFDQAFVVPNVCYSQTSYDGESYTTNYPDPDDPVFDDPNLEWGDDLVNITGDAPTGTHRYFYQSNVQMNAAKNFYQGGWDPVTNTSTQMPIVYNALNCTTGVDIVETTLQRMDYGLFALGWTWGDIGLPFGYRGDTFPTPSPIASRQWMVDISDQGQVVSWEPVYNQDQSMWNNFWYIPFPMWNNANSSSGGEFSIINDALHDVWYEAGQPMEDPFLWGDLILSLSNITMNGTTYNENGTFHASDSTYPVYRTKIVLLEEAWRATPHIEGWNDGAEVEQLSVSMGEGAGIYGNTLQIEGVPNAFYNYNIPINGLNLHHSPPWQSVDEFTGQTEEDTINVHKYHIFTIYLKVIIENEFGTESEVTIRVRLGATDDGFPIDVHPWGWGVNYPD